MTFLKEFSVTSFLLNDRNYFYNKTRNPFQVGVPICPNLGLEGKVEAVYIEAEIEIPFRAPRFAIVEKPC